MSLYSKIIDRQKLIAAWDKVKRNKPASGVDEISYEDFSVALKENISGLFSKLSSHTYEPLPVKMVLIYKGEKVRKIALFTMQDKVVQQSLASELVKIYEPLLSKSSYAYRPGRAALQAIELLNQKIREEKFTWIMKLDIEDFFDNIVLEKLYAMLKKRIKEEDVINLIRISCETPVLEKDGQLHRKIRGLYQGSGIAPVLSNVYLQEFDHEFSQKCSVLIRYSDDILILGNSKEELESIQKEMKVRLQELGLLLNEKKTILCEITKGVDFLGYHLSSRGKNIPAKAEANLSDKLEQVWLTEKMSIEEKLRKGSEILGGWEQYYRNEREVASIQEYVIIIYCVRHKEKQILESVRKKRSNFKNIYKEILQYLAMVWKENGYENMELWEYEDYFELSNLDTDIKIANPSLLSSYYNEIVNAETKENWIELMQLYSDVGAYNKAQKIMDIISKFQDNDVSRSILAYTEEKEKESDLSADFLQEYFRVFAGREDTYGKEELNNCKKRCVEQIPEPLTEDIIKGHLLGQYTVSTYVQRNNQTVKYLVIDVDISKRVFLNTVADDVVKSKLHIAVNTAQHIMKELQHMGLKGYVEESGFRGYHIWIFFTEWIPTRYAVMLAEVIEGKLDFNQAEITVEFFPNKGRIKNGSFGQSIKMPGGIHVRTGRKSQMLNSDFSAADFNKEYLMELAQFPLQTVKKIIASNTKQEIPMTKVINDSLDEFGELSETVKVVLAQCNLMRYLCHKAKSTGYLTHFERQAILYVFAHLGEDGKNFVHTVMECTLNYQYHVTEKFIQKLPEKPISCIKLREQYKQITAEYGCSCNFKRTKNCYPSPVLHGIKSSGDVSEDITLPTSRTLSKEKEQKVVEELNIHKKVQELTEKIIEFKKQKRGVDKAIQKTENELEQIFNQAGIDSLEVDMGVLVRRKIANGYEWLIEI